MKYDNSYVKTTVLPCTEMNTTNSTNYAKIADIRTHIYSNNASTGVGNVAKTLFLMGRAFIYNSTTFEECLFTLRCKTGLTQDENKIIVNKNTSFKLILSYNADGTCSLYASTPQYTQVKIQILEGDDRYIKFYYNAKLDTPLASITTKLIPPVQDLILGDSARANISIDETQTNITINTPVGGVVQPSRDGSIQLGTETKRFKGGYFTNFIQVPVRSTGTPTPLVDGATWFSSRLNKLVTYYNGNYYSNGEIVSIS